MPGTSRSTHLCARYLGIVSLKNEKCGTTYSAHVWLVDFLRANNVDYPEPLKGLLAIRTRFWIEHTKDDPSSALAPRCKIMANHRGKLLGIHPIELERMVGQG